MAREFATRFYKSKAWKKCRESYINSVHGLCEECLANGAYTPGEIVHHLVTLTPANINNQMITLNHEKLRCLCLECHNKEHEEFVRSTSTANGLAFDANGDLVRVDGPPSKHWAT